MILFLAFSWPPGCNAKETAEQNSQFQETLLTYLFLCYCATNLIFDKHAISTLAPRYVLHVHAVCSQCFVIKFYPCQVKCLNDTL